MTIIKAVIGANYGDEGKGLFTDFWTRALRDEGKSVTVIRFNGGAQAGHTVVREDGARHVFGHLGSGSFSGAATHLSGFFVVNPMMFQREWNQFMSLGKDYIGIVEPRVTVDPSAMVTTPWDMLLNQWRERDRGDERHGSCGMGFRETIARNETAVVFDAEDIFDCSEEDLRSFCKEMEQWFDDQVRTSGITVTPQMRAELEGTNWIEVFLYCCEFFRTKVKLAYDHDLGNMSDALIFEGAQGLGLHQDRGHFPHVTSSETGLENVMFLTQFAHLDDVVEVYYATRSYLTRHGAGPMDDVSGLTNLVVVQDPTNQPNTWQGTLRTETLNVKAWAERIEADLASTQGMKRVVNIAVSHMDPELTGERMYWSYGKKPFTGPRAGFFADLCDRLQIPPEECLVSCGPTSETVNFGKELLARPEFGKQFAYRAAQPYSARFPKELQVEPA